MGVGEWGNESLVEAGGGEDGRGAQTVAFRNVSIAGGRKMEWWLEGGGGPGEIG